MSLWLKGEGGLLIENGELKGNSPFLLTTNYLLLTTNYFYTTENYAGLTGS